MITFDKASNVVKLTNGKIDYAVYINTEGYLETVYFGKAIRNFDPTTMRTAPKGHAETHVYDPAIGSERWFADGFKQNVAPLEISPTSAGHPLSVRAKTAVLLPIFCMYLTAYLTARNRLTVCPRCTATTARRWNFY